MQTRWEPLEAKLGRARCVGFMYMGRVNGINLYKHGITRGYLNLADDGQCYVYCGYSGYKKAEFTVELAKLEACLKQMGETLESAYDDEYIARKDGELHQAGIPVLRLQIKPDDKTIH